MTTPRGDLAAWARRNAIVADAMADELQRMAVRAEDGRLRTALDLTAVCQRAVARGYSEVAAAADER